jgi:hypothetical protein
MLKLNRERILEEEYIWHNFQWRPHALSTIMFRLSDTKKASFDTAAARFGKLPQDIESFSFQL